MKNYILILTLLSSCAIVVHGIHELIQFANMVQQVTGNIAILTYINYGCYCGIVLGGTPRDATDWCCFRLSCCYARMEQRKCKMANYDFTYKNKNVICSSKNPCGMQTCECHKTAAYCFRDSKTSYDIFKLRPLHPKAYRAYLLKCSLTKRPSC
uniref:Phospholipase A2 n=1 Tax=Geotrypetes seraphini TaxID=260995 RepID=A0A6P8PRA5_GEOSA|nr:acidic phospholipase A2 BpirPLA2-I-like [Geotrypetes seraphini]